MFFASLAALAPAALAQSWEVGFAGGGSFDTSETVQNPAGNGSAGLAPGFGVSAWVGNNGSGSLGGELRYDYERSDLRLSAGGTTVNFAGQSNAVHYDVVWHMASSESHIRPFIAAGAGVKLFSGTGAEDAYQPLSNLALLTKTSQIEPVVSVGGGVKFSLSKSVQMRLEVHDYLSPFPTNIIAPAANSKIGGWISDIVVSAGLSFAL
jgi:hypothetical protein